MSIDTYKLTSMEEPTDEVLSQLMREAAQDAQKANEQATQRYFEELRQAAADILTKDHHLPIIERTENEPKHNLIN